MKTKIFQNNRTLEKKDEKFLLDLLSIEVDNIFLGLRKADQIIRRELNWLHKTKVYDFKNYTIDSIDATNLKNIIEQMPPQHFLVDEYVAYMLENDNNSIFHIIQEYNLCVESRNKESSASSYTKLKDADEKLVYYIRNLGAMMYHFNIHLNLLHVLLKNTSTTTES